MELSCPLGIRVMSRNDNLSCYGALSRIINPLLTKLIECVHCHVIKNIIENHSVDKVKKL